MVCIISLTQLLKVISIAVGDGEEGGRPPLGMNSGKSEIILTLNPSI